MRYIATCLSLTFILSALAFSGCTSTDAHQKAFEPTPADKLTRAEVAALVNNARGVILKSPQWTMTPEEIKLMLQAKARLTKDDYAILTKPNIEIQQSDKEAIIRARRKITAEQAQALEKAKVALTAMDIDFVKRVAPKVSIGYTGTKQGKAIITWPITERVKLIPTAKVLTDVERKRVTAIATGNLLGADRQWRISVMRTQPAVFIGK